MFLPVSKNDLITRNLTEVDFVFVSGDAYIDHPSFGVAIISRILEAFGFKIAILAQPRIDVDSDFTQFGKPRYGFLVSSGNIDSMVNHYSVSKRRREKDYYTEGGIMGKRPDYAVVAYSKVIKRLFPDSPIILGGIEASLRRMAHYDYYSDKLKQSILIESEADIICYGMSDESIVEVCEALRSGLDVSDLIYIRGTVWKTKDKSLIPEDCINLPNYQDLLKNKLNYAKSFNIQYQNTDPINSKVLVEQYNDLYVIQNQAANPLSSEYLDWVYSLPYMRNYHPMYKRGVPAIEEVKYSIAVNRGCMGSCSFCALTFHQGRIMQTRSEESIVNEAIKITNDKDFKGYIHDVGGPTANFFEKACDSQEVHGACKFKKCLHPTKCKKLVVSHEKYLGILRKLRQLPNVKKVFIRSGIRYDYLMYDKNDEFFEELIKYHISGQLKVAPEHVNNEVLEYMQKPNFQLYEEFVSKYNKLNEKHNMNQFLVPYLMSSHPGSTIHHAIELAEYLHKNRIRIDQVQDFYPTPGTLSTCMYYTGVDPRTMKKVYVEKKPYEKAMQRALIQYYKPNNYDLVYQALKRAGRDDLIGSGEKCLIKFKKNNRIKPKKMI